MPGKEAPLSSERRRLRLAQGVTTGKTRTATCPNANPSSAVSFAPAVTRRRERRGRDRAAAGFGGSKRLRVERERLRIDQYVAGAQFARHVLRIFIRDVDGHKDPAESRTAGPLQ